jgi:hypothetical protein
MKSILSVLFLGCIFAASLAFGASTLENFINSSFEPGQKVNYTALLPSSNAVLIAADGVETYVFDTAENKPIYDVSRMSALLAEDSKSRSGFSSLVLQAKSFSQQVLSAKSFNESVCMRLTGTDTHNCTDKDSCVLACMSNPNCATPLYSDGFWESILEWTTLRKKFDSTLSQFDDGIDEIESSTAAIDSKLAVLENLSLIEKQLKNSQLFLNRTDEGCSGPNATKRCFEYCPKIDYSGQAIESQKKSLNDLKKALQDLQRQPSRAAAIANASKQNDLYLSTRLGNFTDLKIRMQRDAIALNRSAKELLEKINDSAIPDMLNSLSNISESIIEAGNQGRYREALSKKKEYESAYSGLSGRMESDMKKYNETISKIDSLMQKANSSKWVLGESYEKYSSQLLQIKANLTKSPVALSQLDALSSAAAKVGVELAEEVSSKVAQGGAEASKSNPKSALPCLPAFIAIFTLAFAAGMRRV